MMPNISERIKMVRRISRESQQSFAANLGVNRSHISNIETGAASPSDQLLKSICRAYGVKEEWLKQGGPGPIEFDNPREPEDLFDRIKHVRILAHESQQSFASVLGVDRSHISKIETGAASPSDQLLKSICRAYGVNEEWLKFGRGPVKNEENKSREEDTVDLLERKYSNMTKEIIFYSDLVDSLLFFLEKIEKNYLDIISDSSQFWIHDGVLRRFKLKLNKLQSTIDKIAPHIKSKYR